MSTGLVNVKATRIPQPNRFAEIARLGEIVFHTNDLANLWRITKKNTLYTAIKRYVQNGLLFPIHKGFYAIKPIEEIDPVLLGIKALHGCAYASCETVLAEDGIIQQIPQAITLVGAHTRRFAIGPHRYYTRKLATAFLHNPAGIVVAENGVRKAGRERAIADMLYFNPRSYFDAAHLIDWDRVSLLQRDIGYPPIPKHHG